MLERIIAKEKPDAILPTMGGQTALNLAMDLNREGILEKYGVELIGAKPDVIDKAEDRQRFKEAMEKIGLESARSGIAYAMAEALEVQQRVGFPAVIRPSYCWAARRRYCIQHAGIRRNLRARFGAFAHARTAH